ncbi:hypothetical protein ACIF8T_38250 [Streptomyces sp. NPDC085946]|uniref:hypothetical protein n=1 Tax=Streptomyces sp. NPDC085946 TaxID=3365744 RepID=UPI0037D70E94
MARDRDTPNPFRFPSALVRRARRRLRNRLAAHWNDRAATWMTRAEERAARRRLRRAERLLRRAIKVTTSERTRRHFYLNLSLLLQQRHELSLRGDPLEAGEAVTAARRALAGLSTEEEWWCAALCTLADALLLVHTTGTGTEAQLEEAVHCMVRAVADAPRGSDELPALIVRLGNALERSADSGTDIEALDRAFDAARRAVAEAPGEARSMARFALAEALCSVASAADWTAALDEGIEIYRDIAPEFSPDSGVLHALGTALLLRDEAENDPEAVAEGLRVLREAVSVTVPGSTQQHAVEQDLAAALHTSYEHNGNSAFLDEAITLLRTTVDATPSGEPVLTLRRLRLAIALDARATRTGEPDDAREALDLLTRALADSVAEEDDEEHASVLLALANTLLTLGELTGEPGLVPKAISYLRTAAQTATGTLLQVRIYSSLVLQRCLP